MVPTFAPTPRETGRVVVAIPALNESRSIGSVVQDLVQRGYACVVVDDGSSDRTGAAARQAGATVLRHPIPLGQGAALQTGIYWALADGADVIVTFDADGQHRPTDIPVLLEALTRHDADYALGSRFLGTTVHAPARRRLLLTAATRFTPDLDRDARDRHAQRLAGDDASWCGGDPAAPEQDGARIRNPPPDLPERARLG